MRAKGWGREQWDRGEKRGDEKRKGRRRVNASCFLTRPIFNQHCLYSSNNRRKLARLDTHWVWMPLLILVLSLSRCPNPPHDFLRGVSFTEWKKERKKKKIAAASILLLMTGYPLCLSVCVSASSLYPWHCIKSSKSFSLFPSSSK